MEQDINNKTKTILSNLFIIVSSLELKWSIMEPKIDRLITSQLQESDLVIFIK